MRCKRSDDSELSIRGSSTIFRPIAELHRNIRIRLDSERVMHERRFIFYTVKIVFASLVSVTRRHNRLCRQEPIEGSCRTWRTTAFSFLHMTFTTIDMIISYSGELVKPSVMQMIYAEIHVIAWRTDRWNCQMYTDAAGTDDFVTERWQLSFSRNSKDFLRKTNKNFVMVFTI